MPNEKKTLTEVFTDVADAIREKKDSEEPICPLNFADEIANIETDPTADFESDRWYHKGSDGMESGGIGDHGVYSLNGGEGKELSSQYMSPDTLYQAYTAGTDYYVDEGSSGPSTANSVRIEPDKLYKGVESDISQYLYYVHQSSADVEVPLEELNLDTNAWHYVNNSGELSGDSIDGGTSEEKKAYLLGANGNADQLHANNYGIYSGHLYMGTSYAGGQHGDIIYSAKEDCILEEASGNSVSNGYYHIDGDGELFGASASEMEVSQIGDGLFAYDATGYSNYVYGVSGSAYTPIATTTVQKGRLYELDTEYYESSDDADLYYKESDWEYGSPIHEADTTSLSNGLYQVSGNFEAVGNGQIDSVEGQELDGVYDVHNGTLVGGEASLKPQQELELGHLYAYTNDSYSQYVFYSGDHTPLEEVQADTEKWHYRNEAGQFSKSLNADSTLQSYAVYTPEHLAYAFYGGKPDPDNPYSGVIYGLYAESDMKAKELTPTSVDSSYMYKTDSYGDVYVPSGMSLEEASGQDIYGGWCYTSYPGKVYTNDQVSFTDRVDPNDGYLCLIIGGESGRYSRSEDNITAPTEVGASVDVEVEGGNIYTITLKYKV